MQPDLWTLNRLALELGRDRRALGRDLEGLKPAESIRKGNRTERKWRLRDVVEHLYAQRPADDAEHAPGECLGQTLDVLLRGGRG